MFEWVTPEIWRKMVRAALEKPLGLAGVLEAIAFWNANFSHVSDLQKHMRPFAQAFSEFVGRPEAKTEYALLLISALHTHVALLPEDPAPDAATPVRQPVRQPASVPAQFVTDDATQAAPNSPNLTSTVPKSQPTAPSAPPNAVDASLDALITALRSEMALDSQARGYAQLFSQRIQAKPTLRVMGLQSAQLPAWVDWLRKPEQTPLAAQLSVAQANQLVGLIYVFLAEALGPVDADRMLSSAVQVVEATPAGRVQSPRAFL